MSVLVIALAMLAQQATGPLAYVTLDSTTGQPLLALQQGTFDIAMDPACSDLALPLNVEWLVGAHNGGAVQPIGSNRLCQIAITGVASEQPCATNADGECDVSALGG
jgi:hypothetical protein